MYNFSSQSELDGWTLWGLTNAYYNGGGYVKELISPLNATSKNETLNIINQLQSNQFIDAATRAVFLEFVVYDVNSNFFVMSTIAFELPTSGDVVSSSFFFIGQFERYNSYDRRLIAIEVIVLFFVVGHFISEFQQVIYFVLFLMF